MKLYESYVAEAKARRRRRMAIGIVGAVMLATVAMAALLVLDPPALARGALSADCAAGGSSSVLACGRGATGLAG
jgi:hypothetical protein